MIRADVLCRHLVAVIQPKIVTRECTSTLLSLGQRLTPARVMESGSGS